MNSNRNELLSAEHIDTKRYRTRRMNRRNVLLCLTLCMVCLFMISMSFTREFGLTSELFAAGTSDHAHVLMETDPCYNVDTDVKMVKGGLNVFKTAVSWLHTPTDTSTVAETEPETSKTITVCGPARLNCNGIPISGKTVPDSIVFDADGIPVNYSRVIYGKATAYSNDTITSTGTVPVQGSVAVNPNVIPYGTEMWIVSSDGQYVYGYCKAEDTGGFIYLDNGPDVDLFFDYESDCEEWGIRNVTIYIF